MVGDAMMLEPGTPPRFTLGSDAARNAKAVSGEASTLTSARARPVIRFPHRRVRHYQQ